MEKMPDSRGNIEHAQILAEGAKPLIDIAREDWVNEDQKKVLDDLAIARGEKILEKELSNQNQQSEKSENSVESHEKMSIPVVVKGSFSNTPGEAGIMSWKLADDKLANHAIELGIAHGRVHIESTDGYFYGDFNETIKKGGLYLVPKKDEVVFVMSQPYFTQFPPPTNRNYGQTCISWLPYGSNSNAFLQCKFLGEYESSNGTAIEKPAEVTIPESGDVPEKLLNAIRDCIRNDTRMVIEAPNGTQSVHGNDMLDFLPAKVLFNLFSKLTPDEQKKCAISFGYDSVLYPTDSQKPRIFVPYKILSDKEKATYEKNGYVVKSWSEVI